MANQNTKQSPENYIKSGKARKLPIYECKVLEDFAEVGMTHVMVTRQHLNGNLTSGIYLVDLFCLGIKDSMFFFNMPKEEYENLAINTSGNMIEVDYTFAHNLIFGAEAYAEELGLSAHYSFKLTQHILEEDTDDIELIHFDFGDKGKPHLMINPTENRNREINILTKKFGIDGFTITRNDDFLDDDEFDEDEFDENEFDEDDLFDDDDAFIEARVQELNDNDEIYFISAQDLKHEEKIVEIMGEPNEIKKIELFHQLFIQDDDPGPDFLIDSMSDVIFAQQFSNHVKYVSAIQFLIPEIDTENKIMDWYSEQMEKIDDEFDEIFCSIDEDEKNPDFDRTNNKAIQLLKEKYRHNELFFLFCYDSFFEFQPDEDRKKLAIDYIEEFPNSTYARAVYIYEKLIGKLHYDEEITENCVPILSQILFQCPFTIKADFNFRVSNSINNKVTLMEVLSFLFVQGFYHLSQNKIAEAEACMKEIAKLRAKDWDYFDVLRKLLTITKSKILDDDGGGVYGGE